MLFERIEESGFMSCAAEGIAAIASKNRMPVRPFRPTCQIRVFISSSQRSLRDRRINESRTAAARYRRFPAEARLRGNYGPSLRNWQGGATGRIYGTVNLHQKNCATV